jgi:hypothetical protein
MNDIKLAFESIRTNFEVMFLNKNNIVEQSDKGFESENCLGDLSISVIGSN